MFLYKFKQLHIALHSVTDILERSSLNWRFLFKNGFKCLHPVNIFVCYKRNLYFLWDRFKHISDSQFLEIVTTSKEIMSFHDHGVVVFRFDRSHNESPAAIAFPYLLVKGGL